MRETLRLASAMPAWRRGHGAWFGAGAREARKARYRTIQADIRERAQRVYEGYAWAWADDGWRFATATYVVSR